MHILSKWTLFEMYSVRGNIKIDCQCVCKISTEIDQKDHVPSQTTNATIMLVFVVLSCSPNTQGVTREPSPPLRHSLHDRALRQPLRPPLTVNDLNEGILPVLRHGVLASLVVLLKNEECHILLKLLLKVYMK